MRDSSSRGRLLVARLATGVAIAAAAGTGYIFHGLPYGSERDGWLTAHGFLGTLAGLLASWFVWHGGLIMWRGGMQRRAGLLALATVMLLFVTGYLSVAAWDDGDQLMRIAGVPFLPGMGMVSSAVGDNAEPHHKLLMEVLAWLILVTAGVAAWRRGGSGR